MYSCHNPVLGHRNYCWPCVQLSNQSSVELYEEGGSYDQYNAELEWLKTWCRLEDVIQ